MRKLILGSVALIAAFILSATACFAQGGTGDLTGSIYDASGASVAGAKVTLKNSDTGAERTMQSTDAGTYRFAALPVVGTYTLWVEHEGFRAAKVSGVMVSVGLTNTVDVHLDIGSASETVTVEAGAELVTPSESQISQLVDSRVWQSLPLEIRNQNTFINLVAGVVPNDFGGTTRGAAVNGARPGMGNFLLEGYDNNDQGQGGRGSEGSGAITSISPEAIQEYRVITHSYEAEYGKGGAFVTDTVLKSGTNQFHGSAFEYNRVQKLAANDFFSNAAGVKDSLVRNQFGGSMGGAILKDRWFLYASYEGHRRRQSAPVTATGTTQDFINFVKSGAFETFMESDPNGLCQQAFGSACAGAFSQSSTLGPIAANLLSTQPFPLAQRNFTKAAEGLYTSGFFCAFTNPNCNTILNPTPPVTLQYPVNAYGEVTVSDPNSFNQHRVSFKSDYKLSNSDQLSGTLLYTNEELRDGFGGGDATLGPAFVNPAISVLIGLNWTHSFTPLLLNQFRASYLRRRSDFPDAPGTNGIPSIVNFNDALSVGFGNSSSLPQFFTDGQFQYKDDLSYIYGKHSLKFGGEYRRTRNASSFQAAKNGLFQPYSIEELLTDGFSGDEADLLLDGGPLFGAIGFAQASINPLTGGFPEYYRGYRANEIAWYTQDDWKIHPRFTINLGLRWEYFGPPHNFRRGIDSNIFFGLPLTPIPNPFPTCTATPPPLSSSCPNPFFPLNSPLAAEMLGARAIQVDHNIWHKDTNNFGPRLGFAWDVFGNQKLVFRGGGGFYYDRIWNNLFENIRFNPPFFAFSSLGFFAGAPAVGPLATPGLYAVPFSDTQAFQKFAGLPAPRHMDQSLVTPYTQQYNAGIQWSFTKDTVLEVDGTYTGGRALTGVTDINTYNGRVACSSATARAACVAAQAAGDIPRTRFSSRRINTGFAGDNFRSNNFGSNYYGLLASVTKRISHGLQFNSNYTWSHAIDTLSDAFNNARGAILRPTDNFNIPLDKGNADFDIRHRFVTSAFYELPILRKSRWLGGWSMSGILTLQKGVPVQIFTGSSSGDTNRDGYNTDRPLITGSPYVSRGSPADGWLTPTDPVTGVNPSFVAATCPATTNFGLWCDSPTGRNTLRAPGFVNTDFGVAKNFKFTERWKLQFQANFFNIFNHPNFGVPNGNLASGSTFGLSTFDFNGPRITQLALRFDF